MKMNVTLTIINYQKFFLNFIKQASGQNKMDLAIFLRYSDNNFGYCESCKCEIKCGDISTRWYHCYVDEDDENGKEQFVRYSFFCEECSDAFFSLDELGFWVKPTDDVNELLAKYEMVNEESRIMISTSDFYGNVWYLLPMRLH